MAKRRTFIEASYTQSAEVIVFEDADIDAAVAGAMSAKYRNNGQTCVCANRIYVHDALYDSFAEKFANATRQLKVGDGFSAETTLGPLIDEKALSKVERHIADACAKGARILVGGGRHARGGLFFEPTVLTEATAAMHVAQEETFGPLAPLFRFRDEAEVLRQANDTPFGLAAYFYTRDLARTWRIGEALDYGMVGVNTGVISAIEAPFGGIKQSGIGREGSRYGLDAFTEIKYLCLGGL